VCLSHEAVLRHSRGIWFGNILCHMTVVALAQQMARVQRSHRLFYPRTHAGHRACRMQASVVSCSEIAVLNGTDRYSLRPTSTQFLFIYPSPPATARGHGWQG
jgi:hypothetical protein